MPAHEKRDERVRRQIERSLADIGAELRRARLNLDLSQARAAAEIGLSAPTWSRIERGDAPQLNLSHLALACSVVGLDLHVRTYPGGRVTRDRAHLELLERFRQRLSPGATGRTEVPLPNPGDRRAWDALLGLASVRIGIEAETRCRDAEDLQRQLNGKRRDGGVDEIILLLADTRHNRALVRAAGAGFLEDYPVPGRVAVERLAQGLDPGGSAIVFG